MSQPQFEVGQSYIINHSRKGTFGLKVTGQCDEWLHGVVNGGQADAIMEYNVKEKGDEITVRKSLILHKPIILALAFLLSVTSAQAWQLPKVYGQDEISQRAKIFDELETIRIVREGVKTPWRAATPQRHQKVLPIDGPTPAIEIAGYINLPQKPIIGD